MTPETILNRFTTAFFTQYNDWFREQAEPLLRARPEVWECAVAVAKAFDANDDCELQEQIHSMEGYLLWEGSNRHTYDFIAELLVEMDRAKETTGEVAVADAVVQQG
jgi:hypothetical protein